MIPIPVERLPAEQRSAFADGLVSTREYQAAFQSFRTCANESQAKAVETRSVDASTGLIVYEVNRALDAPGAPASDPLNACYQRYFSYIELAWQTSDPTFVAASARQQTELFDATARPCLTKNSVALPAAIVPGSDIYGKLLAKALELQSAGEC